MVNYVKLAATTKRIIESTGRDIVLIRKSRVPGDAAKPWRGPASLTDQTVGTVKAVIYPAEEKDESGALIRRGYYVAMLAHDSLSPAENLSDLDSIQDGGVTYKVDKASIIGPGDVKLAYELHLKR
jgi:hypothetical protein